MGVFRDSVRAFHVALITVLLALDVRYCLNGDILSLVLNSIGVFVSAYFIFSLSSKD